MNASAPAARSALISGVLVRARQDILFQIRPLLVTPLIAVDRRAVREEEGSLVHVATDGRHLYRRLACR